MYIKLYVTEIFDIYVNTFIENLISNQNQNQNLNRQTQYIYSVKNIQRLFKMFNASNCYISNSLKSDM